ncbi:MAG TPA: glycosyl hydrolase, partial [Tangfeifania sp.]|nr:glycosyl hydrolase [Tangfeifania sp.]
MKKPIKPLLSLCLLIFLLACKPNNEDTSLFVKFQNPAPDARPMVRWWWNGNCVEADEIKRELNVMYKAGIGGVEINSIAMPPHAKKTDAKPLQWAGKEWINSVKVASDEAHKLGMIADLIVGSGWPFGGRFLKDDETMQRLGIKRQSVKANSNITINLNEYLTFQSHHTPGTQNVKATSDVELVTVKLIPVNLKSPDEIIDITSEVKDNKLEYKTGNTDYELVFVYNERNFKSVYHGSPGADGPIMDHYKADVVRAYLNRLKAIEKETGVPLSEIIRALFCDSIELGGSNWTDDMKEQFMSKNGYDITPWLPFAIKPDGQSNKYEMSEEMDETITRIQYDYYNTIIAVFLERFTSEFQDFCTENNVLCRYQAYGTPFYMGLFQGNMIPDIPESNNWIYSRGRNEAETSEYTWVRNHGYMLWNKAASSGAHITGKKITSCEAMTNTSGVFRTSLETVKQSDDMNFITGINHTVLHGYNYSPPEAGFPGWMRYGAYFSEHNTWWKYFKYWADYNARLSSVFQNSKPTADIAVLGRVRDYWGEVGPARIYLNDKPWYYAKLWEPISNLGSSCDYIHQPVLETAAVDGAELVCGEMRYKLICLTDVESLTPEAAQTLSEFAQVGGKVVFIGTAPHRSLSYKNAAENDQLVKTAIEKMNDTGNAFLLDAPTESADFIAWTKQLMQKTGLEPQVKISNPQTNIYAMKQTAGKQELYFFANSDRKKNVEFDATFDTDNKTPYLWNPATGERFALVSDKNNKL